MDAIPSFYVSLRTWPDSTAAFAAAFMKLDAKEMKIKGPKERGAEARADVVKSSSIGSFKRVAPTVTANCIARRFHVSWTKQSQVDA